MTEGHKYEDDISCREPPGWHRLERIGGGGGVGTDGGSKMAVAWVHYEAP